MEKEYPITSIAPTVSAILGLPAPVQARDAIIQEMVADLGTCSRVAILGVDALGVFPFQQWKGEMPFLNSLHAQRSVWLRSIMPSITPVNFAAIVTGADQSVHGVQTFYDDIRCQNLFDVVRTGGGCSAGIGREGYTGAELLARLADIPGRGSAAEKDEAVDRLILQIADQDRPQFLIAQFGETDDVLHRYGPSSPHVLTVFRKTDGRLRLLSTHLVALGYGIIVLADHGQHDVEPEPPRYYRGMHGTDCDEDCLVPCTWVASL